MSMTFQRPVLNRHACGAGSEDPNPDSGMLRLTAHELAGVNAGFLPAVVPFVLANPGFAAGVVGGAAIVSRFIMR